MFERGFLWRKSIVKKKSFFSVFEVEKEWHMEDNQLFLLFRTSWRSLMSWAQHETRNRLFKFTLPRAWYSHSIAFRKNIKNFLLCFTMWHPQVVVNLGLFVWGLPHCHIFSLHYSQIFDITIIFVFNLISCLFCLFLAKKKRITQKREHCYLTKACRIFFQPNNRENEYRLLCVGFVPFIHFYIYIFKHKIRLPAIIFKDHNYLHHLYSN